MRSPFAAFTLPWGGRYRRVSARLLLAAVLRAHELAAHGVRVDRALGESSLCARCPVLGRVGLATSARTDVRPLDIPCITLGRSSTPRQQVDHPGPEGLLYEGP